MESYKYQFFSAARITDLVFILNIYIRIGLVVEVYAVIRFNYRLFVRGRYRVTIYINCRLSSRGRGRVTTYIKMLKCVRT